MPAGYRVPVLVVAVAVLVAGGVLGAGVTAGSGHAPASVPAGSPARPGATSAVASPAGPTASAPLARAASAEAAAVGTVERQIADGSLPADVAFLPSTHAQAYGTLPDPALDAAPAPMGLADFGIGGGSGVSYTYNSSSFEANLTISDYSAFTPGLPAFGQSPNWSAIQLNTVAANVAYPGATNGTFWIQNVLRFNGTTVQFEDNIWNFSSPTFALPPETMLSGDGTNYLGEFYYAFGPTCVVTEPFSVTLYNNVTEIGGHPAVFLNYSLAGCAGHSYDEVVFNGTSAHGSPPLFRVSGSELTPAGLFYDAEVAWAGNGGGSNVDFQNVSATVALSSWNSTALEYDAIPSAYDYGVDTGETSYGIAATYSGTTESLVQGPSLLYGLWNTTHSRVAAQAASGAIHVQLTLTPSYAFVFAANWSKYSLSTPSLRDLSYAPSTSGGVMATNLPPPAVGDPYVFAAWADGFDAGRASNVTGGVTGALTLSPASSVLNAPIYLAGDAQLGDFGSSVTAGTSYVAGNQTLDLTGAADTLAQPFLVLNDFAYPTFMLLAVQGLAGSVHVNDFTQGAGSFTYIFANNNTAFDIPGWTQGYFFFGGTGRFSVANVTIQANASLAHFPPETVSPAAVEFYTTSGSRVSNLTVANDGIGVAALNASAVSAATVTAETGSLGVLAYGTSPVTLYDVAAVSSDEFGGSSLGVELINVTLVRMSDFSVDAGQTGIYSVGATDWTLDTIAVNGIASTGILALNGGDGTIEGATVTGEGALGGMDGGSGFTATTIHSVDSFGIDFNNTTDVSVTGVTATGLGATGVDSFTNSSDGTFDTLAASEGAIALFATNDTGLTISGVNATDGSSGALLFGDFGVIANDLSGSNLSVGVYWNGGANGTLHDVEFGNASAGVSLGNVSNVSVSDVGASESELAFPYFIDYNIFSGPLPTAPVSLYNVTDATVSSVAAVEYPFGVWANLTNDSSISLVKAWNGGIGVATNFTDNLSVDQVFAFGNTEGGLLINASATTVTGSTFEDSVSYGLAVNNSSGVQVYSNNFIANDNASTDGVFDAADNQAYVNNSTHVEFNSSVTGNFWSDHPGSGTYTIRDGATDSKPVASYVGTYLEFLTSGLPLDTPWGVTLLSISYASPLGSYLYVPNFAIPTGSLAWTLQPSPGYLGSPRAGPVAFPGTNTTVTIVYTIVDYVVSFTATGLPSGTHWTVTFQGTPSSNTTVGGAGEIAFSEPNGTYSYTIGTIAGYGQGSLPAHGSIIVDGSNLPYALDYTAFTYAVTFTESGLSAGTSWSVTVNGTTHSSTNTTVTFAEPNGTYSYSIGSVSGWTVSGIPTTGSIHVAAGPVSKSLTFSPTTTTIPLYVYIGIGVGALVVVLAIALLLRRRRRRQPASGPNDEFSTSSGR